MTGPARERNSPDQRPPARRRNLIGGFVLVGVFALVVYLGQGLMVRIGMFPEPTAYRQGTAMIIDCDPAVRWGGWVQRCAADIRWRPAATWRPGLELSTARQVSVISDQPVTGEVAVESHRMPTLGLRGGGTSSAGEMVITGDKRLGVSGWWVIPLAVVPFAAAIAVNALFHLVWNAVVRRRARR